MAGGGRFERTGRMRTRLASKLDRPTEEQQPPRPCKKRKAGRLVVQTMDELASLLAEVKGETKDIKRATEACEGIVQACKRVAEAEDGFVDECADCETVYGDY